MAEESQQNTNPQQSPATPAISGMKVIQPSESFEQEVKTTQPASVQPTPDPQASPVNTTQPLQPKPSPSSVYPDATQGVGTPAPVPTQPAPAEAAQAADPKRAKKILAVRVVAAILILFNGVNAYDVLWSIHNGFKGYGLISILEVVVMLGLAIGIFMFKEIARVTYVFIAAIVLVVSVISIVSLYRTNHSEAFTQSYSQTPLTKAQLESRLQKAEANTTLPPSAKQANIAQVQSMINNLSAPKQVEQKAKQYFSEGLLVFVAIFPLVFFTRPSIKEVFT